MYKSRVSSLPYNLRYDDSLNLLELNIYIHLNICIHIYIFIYMNFHLYVHTVAYIHELQIYMCIFNTANCFLPQTQLLELEHGELKSELENIKAQRNKIKADLTKENEMQNAQVRLPRMIHTLYICFMHL